MGIWKKLFRAGSKAEQPRTNECPACHGAVVNDSDAFFRSFNISFQCKCGRTVNIDGKGVCRSLGLEVVHAGCREVSYVPPAVWCPLCEQNFVANWESLIVRDRAAEAAHRISKWVSTPGWRRQRHPFRAPADAQRLQPPLVECRCDKCGHAHWWTPDGHADLTLEDVMQGNLKQGVLRCFDCGRWGLFNW
jgi:hypothetical protein